MIKDFAMLTMAVRDADVAAADYQAMFGMQELAKGDSADLRCRYVMLSLGNTRVDFIHPHDGNEPLKKFLEENGEGVWAIVLEVEDAAAAADRLKAAGAEIYRDITTSDGTRIIGVPASATHGVTVQLAQVAPGSPLFPPVPANSGGTAEELTLHCIIVRDMEHVVDDWTKMFGTGVATVHEGEELGNKNTMVPLGSKGAHLEIMTPRTGEEDWAGFLDKKGESTFLIGVRVADMDAVIEHIRGTGRRVVGEFTAKNGGRQAMVHPKDSHGVMIELLTPPPGR